jgi:hypothetical protein
MYVTQLNYGSEKLLHNTQKTLQPLSAFAKLRKTTFSFVTPVRLSVRIEQLDSL